LPCHAVATKGCRARNGPRQIARLCGLLAVNIFLSSVLTACGVSIAVRARQDSL